MNLTMLFELSLFCHDCSTQHWLWPFPNLCKNCPLGQSLSPFVYLFKPTIVEIRNSLTCFYVRQVMLLVLRIELILILITFTFQRDFRLGHYFLRHCNFEVHFILLLGKTLIVVLLQSWVAVIFLQLDRIKGQGCQIFSTQSGARRSSWQLLSMEIHLAIWIIDLKWLLKSGFGNLLVLTGEAISVWLLSYWQLLQN